MNRYFAITLFVFVIHLIIDLVIRTIIAGLIIAGIWFTFATLLNIYLDPHKLIAVWIVGFFSTLKWYKAHFESYPHFKTLGTLEQHIKQKMGA